MRLGIISNPLSGGNRRGLQPVREAIAHRSEVIHREAKTPLEVESVMKFLAEAGVDVVAVNGGDGTIQAVLTALFGSKPFRRPPLLAVLRSGTHSVIAEDVGLKGSRDGGLGRLLRWMVTQDGSFRLQERPVLRVQAPPDSHPRYGMIFGAAAVHQGIQYCKRRIHAMGLHGQIAPSLTLARFLLAAILRDARVLRPVPITIHTDSDPDRHGDFLLLYISTLERLFMGLRPHWGREAAPIHVTTVGGRPRHIPWVLASLVRGRQSRLTTPGNGYFSCNAHEIRLTMASGFTLDGELYEPNPQLRSIAIASGGTASFLRL